MILLWYIADKHMIIPNFIIVQNTFSTCIPQSNYLFVPQLPVYSFEVDSIIWHSCEIHENLRLSPGDNADADYRWRYHLTTKKNLGSPTAAILSYQSRFKNLPSKFLSWVMPRKEAWKKQKGLKWMRHSLRMTTQNEIIMPGLPSNRY